MKLNEIREILEAEVLVGEDLLDQEVKMVAGADLLSDVPQVVRTAEVADLAAVCFVRGKRPDKESIEIAESKRIPILTTQIPMFESCGRLWVAGLRGRAGYKKK